MSKKQNKNLSRLVGLYLAGAVICSGMMTCDLTAAEAATNFEQSISDMLSGIDASESAKIKLEQKDGKYTASIYNGAGEMQATAVTSSDPKEKTVNLGAIGLDEFKGSKLEIDTGDIDGIQFSGDTGDVKTNVTVSGSKPMTITGDTNLNAKNITVNTPIAVKDGNLTVSQADGVTTGDVTVNGGSITTNDGKALNAKSLTVTGGNVNAPVKSEGNVNVTGGTVGDVESKGTVSLAKDTTVTGNIKAETVDLAAGATLGKGKTVTTNNLKVADASTIKDVNLQATEGKTVNISGVSTDAAQEILKKMTVVKADGSASDQKVDVVITDQSGNSYESTITPGKDGNTVDPITPQTTTGKLASALKNAKGDVELTLKANENGTTTILLSANGQAAAEVATTAGADKTINLAQLNLNADITSLTVDMGNVGDVVKISGGNIDIPVTIKGDKAANLDIAAGVTVKNLTVTNKNLTVNSAAGAVVETLNIGEGVTVTAKGEPVSAGKLTVGNGATVVGAITTDNIKVGSGTKTDGLTINSSGNLTIDADKETAEKLIGQVKAPAGKLVVKVVNADGTFTEYTATVNADGSVDKGTIKPGETKPLPEDEYLAVFNGRYAINDAFADKPLPDQTALTELKKNVSQAAYQNIYNQVIQAAMVGATPVVAAVQAQQVLSNVSISNVSDRLQARRDGQAGYVIQDSKVKGAGEGEQGNLWAAIKYGQTDIDSDQYGESSIDYTYYQLGYDHQVAEDAYLGLYFGGTTGDITTNNMTTDIDSAYDFGVYGTKIMAEGQYVNLIGRYGTMTNKYRTMDWDTKTYGFTVEYGQKLQQTAGFTMTPYIQLNYGRTSADSLMVGLNTLDTDDSNNLTAKIGAKFEDKDDQGNSVYGGVAYLRGLSGDFDTYMNRVQLPGVNNNLGAVLLNIGIKRQMSDTSYFDFSLEKEMLDYDGWNVQGSLNFAF